MLLNMFILQAMDIIKGDKLVRNDKCGISQNFEINISSKITDAQSVCKRNFVTYFFAHQTKSIGEHN